MERSQFAALDAALSELEARGRELAATSRTEPVGSTKLLRFSPAEQVVARLELAGPERVLPKVHVGIDVRGDGSTEAYVGRIRRRVVEPRDGEDTYLAIRRAVGIEELS